MRLLLDTNAFWFWYEENPRMTRNVHETIRAADEVYVSLVSFWEIAIKTRLRKLGGGPVLQAGIAGLHAEGFLPLTIDYPHILATLDLPMHHGDPFDRMLIAQARIERLTLASSDTAFDAYGIPRIW